MKANRYMAVALAAAAPLAASLQAAAQTPATEIPVEAIDTMPSLYDELDELVITAKKEVVKTDGAKLTYDLEQDDTSKGQSVLDALRKVPMVTVDGQDNIYIKGSQDFRIYVNGKEDPMLTANASKVLKAMPSESVSKIEVITEPGAKYDAEGTGGILNLITERKQTKNGYAGSVSLSYTAQNLAASAYGRMKYGKVTADASVNYANNNMMSQHSNSDTETIDLASDLFHRQTTHMDQRVTFDYVGATLNLSYEPTDRDLFTIGADMNDVDGKIRNIDLVTRMYSRDGGMTWATHQKMGGTMTNLGASGNASYRRLLSDAGQSLTLAYRFSYGRNPWNLDYENSVLEGDISLDPWQKNYKNTYQREHTATADWKLPLADGRHTVEAGAKGIFRRNSVINSMSAGETPDTMLPQPDDTGDTRQIQDVYAAYAAYSGTFGNVSLTGGLRYEHTYMGLDFLGGNHPDFRRNLDDVVPNAAVTYMFGPATNLRLAYQMRISRPTISQLDPSEFRLTQTNIRVGNPDLESERYNSLTLTYSNFGRTLGGSVSLAGYQSDNTIEEFTSFSDGVSCESYGNFGKNRKAELSGFLNWNITPRMSLQLNGSVNFTSIKSGHGDLKNHGWNGQYGANYSYTGPWAVKYSLFGGQSTGNVTLQGGNSGWHYYGLGISRAFLKDDALTVAVNTGNFLTKYTIFKSHIDTDTTRYRTTWRNRNWYVGISLSWNFGHLSDQVKKTGADLENDDTKSTGSKGGGGIGM